MFRCEGRGTCSGVRVEVHVCSVYQFAVTSSECEVR